MSSITKAVIKDSGGIPSPQYYNPITDEYEALQGANGAITVMLANGTPIDLSGTITVGGTAQTLAAVSTTRVTLFVSNPDPTNDLWLAANGLTASANGQGSIRIPANGGGFGLTLPDPVRTAFTIVGAVTGQKFTAWGA